MNRAPGAGCFFTGLAMVLSAMTVLLAVLSLATATIPPLATGLTALLMALSALVAVCLESRSGD